MSFHIIPMYVFSVVLFRTSQISASGLVPSTYIVTRKRSNQNIDCWHKPTSLLHVCVCVGAVVNDSSQSFGCQDDQSGA